MARKHTYHNSKDIYVIILQAARTCTPAVQTGQMQTRPPVWVLTRWPCPAFRFRPQWWHMGFAWKTPLCIEGWMSSMLSSAVTCQCFLLKKKGPVVDMRLHFDIVVHGQLADCMRISASGGRIFSCSFIKTKSILLQQAHENEAIFKPTIYALPIEWDHCVGGIS